MSPKFKRIIAAMVGVFLLVGLSACGVATTTSTTKLQVGAGPFEDAKVKDCIKPGTKDNSPTNDDYYSYPVSDRDFDATGQDGADANPITVVSKDNAEMQIPVTLRFNMVTDCKTLEKFFNAYGQRYSAYLNDDGTTTEGWTLMLRKLMFDPMDTTLDEIAKNYNWRDLYNNPQTQNELGDALKSQIEGIVDSNARGHYFENFTVLLKKPSPTNPELVSAIAAEQAAVAGAASAEAKANADKATAEAQTALAQAEAAKQAAIINGYGSYENYAKSQAIEKGLNPFQPTYIVGGTK